MLKQILNLDGAQELGRKEQKSINGGGLSKCSSDADCLESNPCDSDNPPPVCTHGPDNSRICLYRCMNWQ